MIHCGASQEIVCFQANLGDVQVIKPAAIQLLAGKVASVAGDVRKALDVCRRAVELCEGQARRQAVLKPSNGMVVIFLICPK